MIELVNDIENIMRKNQDNMSLEINENYYSSILGEKSIIIWGNGGTARRIVEELPMLNIKGFLCLDSEESEIQIAEKNFKVINNIQDLPLNPYIIVASIYFDEIKQRLSVLGFVEFIDYISYEYLYPRPSDMLDIINSSNSQTNWVCANAFRMTRLQGDGTVCFCQCDRWLSMARLSGNAFLQKYTEIENSIVAKLFRYSILSGKYCFCKSDECPELKKHIGSFDEDNSEWERIVGCDKANKDKIAKVAVATFDKSCNLRCKSCRNEVIYNENERLEYLSNYFVEQIIPENNIINCAADGEVFVSKYYKNILDKCEEKAIIIFSNGVLAKPEYVDELIKKTNGQLAFMISIDAASEHTYSKLRPGGNFNKLLDNIGYIGQKVAENKVKSLQLNFVMQKANYSEIDDFIKIGKQIGATDILLTHILNWGTYRSDEFDMISLLDENGNVKSDEVNSILDRSEEYGIRIWKCDDYLARKQILKQLSYL